MKRLGIDVGTCYSSAAFFSDGNLRTIQDPLNSLYWFASSVCLTKKNELVIGQAAENQRRILPNRYQREFKRHLGSPIPLSLGEIAILPEDLIAEVLSGIKKEAEKMLNSSLTAATITIPATYLVHKRQLMEKAARKAGFEEVTLLEEPHAAAIYYSFYSQKYSENQPLEEGDIFLVYDLGGGTFDAALVQKQGDGYRLVCPPVGDSECGGIDFDRVIYQDFRQLFDADPRVTKLLDGNDEDPNVLRARRTMADWCRNFKHQLSAVSEHEDMSPIIPESYYLERTRFEAMIAPLIANTFHLCDRLIQQSKFNWEQVSRILLVGGSCRIPYVQKCLEEKFQRPVFRVDVPELAICYGAAIYQVNSKLTAEEFFNRGNVKYKSGDNQGALADYTQAIQLNSNYTDAYFKRGNVKYKLGDNQGALADYTQSIQLNPDYTIAYMNRGNVKSNLGDNQDALADYNQAIQLNHNYTDAYFNRGLAKSHLEDNQGAIADYNQAIKLNPNYADAYISRGNVKYKLGDNQGALADYTQAATLYHQHNNMKLYQKALNNIQSLEGENKNQ